MRASFIEGLPKSWGIATPVCGLARDDRYFEVREMKVVVKKKQNVQELAITTEYIKLQDAMKFANIVMSGGEAKTLIQEEQVLVNGEVCTMRGKKLRDGDTFRFEGFTYKIVNP